MDAETREALYSAAPRAIRRLIGWIDDEETDKKIRIKACEIIIERTFGKVPQPVEGNEGGNLVIQILRLGSTEPKALPGVVIDGVDESL